MVPIFKCLICKKDIERSTKTFWAKKGHLLCSTCLDNIDKNKKILSIGDNLNTDIKGANLLNFDSLLISNGIHKNEIKEKGIERVAKSYETICNFIQSELKW